MNDDDFIRQFEDGSFPHDQWNHRAHVKLAYLYVTRHGFETALAKLRDGIRAYNAAHQVPDHATSGYHETITQFWLRVVHATVIQYGPLPTADEFFDFHPQLSQKKNHRFFYSPATLMTPAAKREFVEPDLTRFPGTGEDAGAASAATAGETVRSLSSKSRIKQSLGQVSLVVRDYDEAIQFYVDTLGFKLVENRYIPEQDKRWVIVAPPGSAESRLLLARAANDEQASRVGNQTGGRVFLFLFTNDFWRDYRTYQARGVTFVREPKEESYGVVAVFQDLYGNLWDLIQPSPSHLVNEQPNTTSSMTRDTQPTTDPAEGYWGTQAFSEKMRKLAVALMKRKGAPQARAYRADEAVREHGERQAEA